MLYEGKLIWQGPVADIDRSRQRLCRPVHPRPRRRADPDAGAEALTMADRTPSLDEVRRWFAEDLRVDLPSARRARRRRLRRRAARALRRAPARGASCHLVDGYWTTPDDDPRRLYHNVLVALDEARGLNTGEPALWARHFDRHRHAAEGDACCRSAPARATTPRSWPSWSGRPASVDGIEIDAALAADARRNLEALADGACRMRRTPASRSTASGTSSWPSPAPPRRSAGGSTRWPTAAACCCR